MKNKSIFKYFTVFLFIVFIGAFFVFSFKSIGLALTTTYENFLAEWKVDFSTFEEIYNKDFPQKENFININGGIQKIIGKRFVNERYMLDNGHLTYIIPELDMNQIAANTVKFKKAVDDLKIPFLYVNAPFKIDADNKLLPPGVCDYSNENADKFLSILKENDVNFLDLRRIEKTQNIDHYSLFLKTDHHWTTQAGFWAFQEIAKHLGNLDNTFKVDERLFDLSNYNEKKYEKIYSGSASQRTGTVYICKDDFSLITPNFRTSLSLVSNEDNKKGNFESTIIKKENLLNSELVYRVYCITLKSLTVTKNFSHNDNLKIKSTQKKLLIINDSFSVVVAPFLSLAYDEIHYIDLRAYKDNLIEYIKKINPDMVMVFYNPGAYEDKNVNMFDFLKNQ